MGKKSREKGERRLAKCAEDPDHLLRLMISLHDYFDDRTQVKDTFLAQVRMTRSLLCQYDAADVALAIGVSELWPANAGSHVKHAFAWCVFLDTPLEGRGGKRIESYADFQQFVEALHAAWPHFPRDSAAGASVRLKDGLGGDDATLLVLDGIAEAGLAGHGFTAGVVGAFGDLGVRGPVRHQAKEAWQCFHLGYSVIADIGMGMGTHKGPHIARPDIVLSQRVGRLDVEAQAVMLWLRGRLVMAAHSVIVQRHCFLVWSEPTFERHGPLSYPQALWSALWITSG